MRDLDDWDYFKEKKVKVKAGENLQNISDILTWVSEDQAYTDELFRLYKEYQLRQKITLKDQIKDIFKFEKAKNNIVFDLLGNEAERLKQECADKYEMLHTNKMLLLRFTREVEDLEAENDSLKSLREENKELMSKRKRELSSSKHLSRLKSMAVLKSATQASQEIYNSSRNDSEREVNSPHNMSRDSVDQSYVGRQEEEMDIFENDPTYMRLKLDSAEALNDIKSRPVFISELNESQRGQHTGHRVAEIDHGFGSRSKKD